MNIPSLKSNALRPLPDKEFYILITLGQGSPLHGYAINKRIPEVSNGEVKMGVATLYRMLHKMGKQGLIEEVEAPPHETSSDQRRIYYAVTDFGIQVMKAESNRFQKLAQLVKNQPVFA